MVTCLSRFSHSSNQFLEVWKCICCHSVCFHLILCLLFSLVHLSRNWIFSFQSCPPASTLTSRSFCPPYWICLVFPPSPLSGGSDLTISPLSHFLFRWRGGVWVLLFWINYTVKPSTLSGFTSLWWPNCNMVRWHLTYNQQSLYRVRIHFGFGFFKYGYTSYLVIVVCPDLHNM